MELENYYYKNTEKLFLSKFMEQKLNIYIRKSSLFFWLFFKTIKKNNALGFIISMLIADGLFPFLLKKKIRNQIYLFGLKIIIKFSYINFLQKFLFLYITGLEDISTLKLKKKGCNYLIILKKNFPYSPELDVFLDNVMRNFTNSIFNIIITVQGLFWWYYNETLARSLNFPVLVNRLL